MSKPVRRVEALLDGGKVEQWELDAKWHREDGPARTQYRPDGSVSFETWCQRGKMHREDGPAWTWYRTDGSTELEEWWLNDRKLSSYEEVIAEKQTEGETKLSVEFKKLSDKAGIPTRSTEGACGYDLTGELEFWAYDRGTNQALATYNTNIAVAIPKGYVGFLVPRSSISKTKFVMHNSVGVIDADYRGSVKMKLIGTGNTPPFENGSRIGQLVIMPCPTVDFVEVNSLEQTKRGDGGFGHTGNK